MSIHEDFLRFIAWANKEGFDVAHSVGDGKYICLNPETANLWKAWKASKYTPAPEQKSSGMSAQGCTRPNCCPHPDKCEYMAGLELPPLPKKRRAMLCTKCGFSGPTEAEASLRGAPCQRCAYIAFVEEVDYSDDEMRAYTRAALATQAAQPSAQGEAVAFDSKLPGTLQTLVAELAKINDKCRPGYMVSKTVMGWLSDALAIARAVQASVAAYAPAAPAQAVPLAEPFHGKRYQQGDWSTRNWEAMCEDMQEGKS